MTDSLIQTSFANGELSPSVFGREDLPKIRAGAAIMRNFFVDYRGGATSRPGTKTIAQALNSAGPVVLRRFQFSITQSYVLELGDHYLRIIVGDGMLLEAPVTVTGASGSTINVTNSWSVGDWLYFDTAGELFQITARTGGSVTVWRTAGVAAVNLPTTGTLARVFTLPTPWAAADLAMLKYTQSADVITFTHPNYVSYDLQRHSALDWRLIPITFDSWNSGPLTDDMTTTPVTSPGPGDTGHDAYYEYVVTAVNGAGEEGLPSGTMGTFAYNMGIDNQTIIVRWKPVAGASFYNVYRASSFNDTSVPAGATHGYVGMTTGTEFHDANIIASFTKTPPIHRDPFKPGQIVSALTNNGGINYSDHPTWSVSDPTGSNFYGYLVVTQADNISGFVITNPGEGYTNPVMTISDSTGSGASITLTASDINGTWPSTCTYFQQRRVFAASARFPETLWGTKPGTISNMDTCNPVVDSDAFTFSLASGQVNNIKWMVSMPGGLVLFTGSGVWQLSGAGQNIALTPSNAVANPQAYTGCADVIPIPINYSILYVQQKGSVVRDLAYNFYANIYTGLDTTVLSNHLFYGYQIVDWAYAEEPYKIIWAVRNDGSLLSLTYLKEQEIIGWCRHDTDGVFEATATISSSDAKEDRAYFVVQRYVNGAWFRFIEVMQNRDFSSGYDSPWCVDAGIEVLSGQRTGVPADLSAPSGTALFTCSAGGFSAGNIGQILRFGGGRGIVTACPSSISLTVALDQFVQDVFPAGNPRTQSTWALSDRISVVTGLAHLEGKEVAGLADGIVVGPLLVSGGQVTLATPASRIILGLGYTAQVKTMYAEGGNQTIQGKRKEIDAVIARVRETRGLEVGPDFDRLEPLIAPYEVAAPIELSTGDYRKPIQKDWTLYGQVAFQQSLPLPASLLAVIYEINIAS